MNEKIEDMYITLPDPDDIPIMEPSGQLLEDFERYGEPVVYETMEEGMDYFQNKKGLSKKEALEAIINDCGFDDLVEYFQKEKDMTKQEAINYINSFAE